MTHAYNSILITVFCRTFIAVGSATCVGARSTLFRFPKAVFLLCSFKNLYILIHVVGFDCIFLGSNSVLMGGFKLCRCLLLHSSLSKALAKLPHGWGGTIGSLWCLHGSTNGSGDPELISYQDMVSQDYVLLRSQDLFTTHNTPHISFNGSIFEVMARPGIGPLGVIDKQSSRPK